MMHRTGVWATTFRGSSAEPPTHCPAALREACVGPGILRVAGGPRVLRACSNEIHYVAAALEDGGAEEGAWDERTLLVIARGDAYHHITSGLLNWFAGLLRLIAEAGTQGGDRTDFLCEE